MAKKIFFFFSLMIFVTTPLFSATFEKEVIVMDQTMKSMKEGRVDPVVFYHDRHNKRVGGKCEVCHDKIFIPKLKANKINMWTIMDETHCGSCHDGRKAFSAIRCRKCHSFKPPEES